MSPRWTIFACAIYWHLLTTLGAAQALFDPGSHYLLRFKIVSSPPTGEGTGENIVRSLDTVASPGKRFFVRVVSDGMESSLWGELKMGETDRKFHVHFAFRESRLGDTVSSPFHFEGETDLNFGNANEVDNKQSAPKESGPSARKTCLVSIEHFQPVIGFRYSTPAWSVRLVDEKGAPIRGARAALFDTERQEVAVGPFAGATDENGILRVSDTRETLHLYTFVAGHPDRGLFAAANLNRDEANETFTVVMREKSKIPKGLQLRKLFE